jgi:hypothetical protein
VSALAPMPRGFSATMAHRDPVSDGVDLFPTPPWGFRAGAEVVRQLDAAPASAWECACGAGHGAHGLADYFARVMATDRYAWRVAPREEATDWRAHQLFDFLGDPDPMPDADWIITNPPFAHAEAFVDAALHRARRGVAMLCRLAFLETQGREPLLYGARRVTVIAPFIERLCMKKGRWDPKGSTAGSYAWFIWLQPWVRRPPWCSPWGPQVVPILTGSKFRLSRPEDLAFAGLVERVGG